MRIKRCALHDAASDLLETAQIMLSAHKARGLTCDTALNNAARQIRFAIAKATKGE
jgi:hypothetical protein